MILNIFRKKKRDNEGLKYVCRMSGYNWYEFNDITKIPFLQRAIAAERAIIAMQRNITIDVLREALMIIIEKMNKGFFVDAAYVVKELYLRTQFACEEKTLTELASVYFLLEGEPADKNIEKWSLKKKEIWSKNPDCAAFFLRRVWNKISGTQNTSQEDIVKYLAENKTKIEALEDFIRDNSKKTSTDTQTT